jgi:hypothetical protein
VNEALAFAILMQASWFIPTTIVGGVFILARAVRRAEGNDLEGRYPPVT